ncbi:MAG: hypothetical protein ACTH5L_04955 [Halomonas sp.]|uniref:hypothetical protein n=1 Tax=Halomonas TaxID=2745 RepID=UPI0018686463|nr:MULTISPECIES: hypothetical protein [Halomonas]
MRGKRRLEVQRIDVSCGVRRLQAGTPPARVSVFMPQANMLYINAHRDRGDTGNHAVVAVG